MNTILISLLFCTAYGKIDEMKLEDLVEQVFQAAKTERNFIESVFATDDDKLSTIAPETVAPIRSVKSIKTEKYIHRRSGRKRCGLRNFNSIRSHHTRTDYVSSKFAEFPWMVAIFRKAEEGNDSDVYEYQCGGSLIHPMAVLTTAKCIYGINIEDLNVRAGEWNIEEDDEFLTPQDRNVVDVNIHENYLTDSARSNMALLFFGRPMDLDDHIQTICLPPIESSFSNNLCYFTGWGRNSLHPSNNFPHVLKKLDMTIYSHKDCTEMFYNISSDVGAAFENAHSLLCAGGDEKRNICEGDEGSPLVCRVPGSIDIYQQAGMAIWGEKCGDKSLPGIYANLAFYRKWIDDKFEYRGLDKATYIAVNIRF